MDLPPLDDRRGPARPPEPKCPYCQAALVSVVVRTSEVIGYRCQACDDTWDVPKPAPVASSV